MRQGARDGILLCPAARFFAEVATNRWTIVRSDPDRFESATWLHKAQHLPKEEFKAEIEKHLTGNQSEPSEPIYFKVYKSQIPVIEETAALLLGSDRSRGYCLEMICADFLSGARHTDREQAIDDAKRLLRLLEPRMRHEALPPDDYTRLR